MDQQRKKYREPKDTLWGKCLSGFIAVVFAVSTLTIIPIASAISGASTEATSEEMAALEAEKVSKQAEDEAAAISAANDKLSIGDIEDESKKDVSTDDIDTVLDTQDVDADAKCDCTGEVHAKDCKAGLTGPIEIEAVEPAVDETLITPATEPEAPVWQVPDGEKTIAAYFWCTNTALGSTTLSTEKLKALGSEEGVNPADLAPESVNASNASYTYNHAQALIEAQTTKAGDNKKYDSDQAIAALRYNQSKTAWEYKLGDGVWNPVDKRTLTFYYHYNQKVGSDGNVVLNSKDWPWTEEEWEKGKYFSQDTNKLEDVAYGNAACAVYQLYDGNGSKMDFQLRTYYYSPNVDKVNNSLSIAKYWQIEEVRIVPVEGKPEKGKQFNYTAPENFSQVGGVTAEDPNSFTIPWQSSWNKQKHACLVAVKVKALPSEQALAVKYINNRTGAVLDTVNITAKKPNGTSSPVWGDYVTIAGNKVSANEGYVIDNGVKVDTNIADKPATISFALDRDGYNPEHVRAEVVKGDGVTAAEVLNLYYNPTPHKITYTDGVENEEIFADKTLDAYYDDTTPGYGDNPTRPGYEFKGWVDEYGNPPSPTVTGDVTYTATWEELYTVTYTDGVESEEVFADQVFDNLHKDTTTPTIADPTRYGYVFAGWSPAVADKVSGNATYIAKWYEDKIDKDNPEKEGPDGIPDVYQMLVTFKVVNGNWNDDTNANAVHVLTFYKDGELSDDAAATAAMSAAPVVGNKPAAGYFSGYRAESWHAVVPTGDVTRTTVLDEYTYTYPAAYTVTYADGANGSVFTSQVAGNLLFDTKTPAFESDVNSLKRAGYVFAGWDKEIAPTVKGNVTYTATWDEDVLGNDPSNPGNTDYSDGIADKYQTIVTFAGVGGTVNGKTQLDYVVTLKDANGNYAVDGTYTLAKDDVPTTAAAEGYAGDPVWSAQNPEGVVIEKSGAAFIASWGNGFVAYYYDGVLGSATDANVGAGQTISVDAAQATAFGGRNYVLDRVDNNNAVVVAGDPGQNVVSVYYDLDEIGNDPDPANPGNVDYSDGVADKYQIVVSYAAVNGTINGIPRVVLDKFDADGKHAVDGTAVLAANQIPGTAPNAGFGPEGSWAPNVPVADMQLTENTDFVITYAATPVEPVNPDEPDNPNPPVNPDEPNPPVNPDEPGTVPDEPGTEPTPGPEGPIAAVVTPPVVAAVTEGVADAVEAIGDGLNPLAAITAPEAIDDDASAMAAFEEIHCWTHWLMIFGALVTIVYGLAVLYRRRRGIRDMDDFEGDITGGRKYDAAAERNPAAGNAFQAM